MTEKAGKPTGTVSEQRSAPQTRLQALLAGDYDPAQAERLRRPVVAQIAVQARSRAAEMLAIPHRPWPLERWREVWAIAQHTDTIRPEWSGGRDLEPRTGPELIAQLGARAAAGPQPAGLHARLEAVAAAYAAVAEHRPTGWPDSPAAALAQHAAPRRTLADAIALLDRTVRAMEAVAKLADPERLERARRRAQRRADRDAAATARARLQWRTGPTQAMTAEQARQMARDAALLAGHDPAQLRLADALHQWPQLIPIHPWAEADIARSPLLWELLDGPATRAEHWTDQQQFQPGTVHGG